MPARDQSRYPHGSPDESTSEGEASFGRACVLSRERGRPKSAETATRTAMHIPSKDGSNQGEVKVIGAPCRTARHKRNPANNSSTMVPTTMKLNLLAKRSYLSEIAAWRRARTSKLVLMRGARMNAKKNHTIGLNWG